MSFTICLRGAKECEVCHYKPEDKWWDPTTNLKDLFDLALVFKGRRGLSSLHGHLARETINALSDAVAFVNNHINQPSLDNAVKRNNGYGTVEDGRTVLGWLHDAAKEMPDARWTVV